MKEVDKLTQSVERKNGSRDHDMNKNKKNLVHIECFDPDLDTRPISQLIKELDEMCQKLGKQDLFWNSRHPIFGQVQQFEHFFQASNLKLDKCFLLILGTNATYAHKIIHTVYNSQLLDGQFPQQDDRTITLT